MESFGIYKNNQHLKSLSSHVLFLRHQHLTNMVAKAFLLNVATGYKEDVESLSLPSLDQPLPWKQELVLISRNVFLPLSPRLCPRQQLSRAWGTSLPRQSLGSSIYLIFNSAFILEIK